MRVAQRAVVIDVRDLVLSVEFETEVDRAGRGVADRRLEQIHAEWRTVDGRDFRAVAEACLERRAIPRNDGNIAV